MPALLTRMSMRPASDHRARGGRDAVGVADVGAQRVCVRAQAARRLRREVLVEVPQPDGGTRFGQPSGDRLADALRRAGHHGDPPAQIDAVGHVASLRFRRRPPLPSLAGQNTHRGCIVHVISNRAFAPARFRRGGRFASAAAANGRQAHGEQGDEGRHRALPRSARGDGQRARGAAAVGHAARIDVPGAQAQQGVRETVGRGDRGRSRPAARRGRAARPVRHREAGISSGCSGSARCGSVPTRC